MQPQQTAPQAEVPAEERAPTPSRAQRAKAAIAAPEPGQAVRSFATPVFQPAPLRAVQTYMTESEIDLLRSARAAALMRRADVTNSAVVRLALRELFDRLGPDGVVDSIVSSDDGVGRQGRPRR